MKKPGEFQKQRQKHIGRQRLFDDVKKSCTVESHEFWIDGCRVITTNKDLFEQIPYTNCYAIIEMKHGFALGYIVTKDCPYAMLPNGTKVSGNIKTKIWCKQVYSPKFGAGDRIWNYETELIRRGIDIQDLPDLYEIQKQKNSP